VSSPTIDTADLSVDAERDVHVNALGVDQIFALYERSGVLYPAKAARLTPHLPAVRASWQRMLDSDGSLFYLLSSGDERDGMASTARAFGSMKRVVGTALTSVRPLGLNFSFLENRCDLLVDPQLTAAEAADVTAALLQAAVRAYGDCASGGTARPPLSRAKGFTDQWRARRRLPPPCSSSGN
jgi:hypothetical protein